MADQIRVVAAVIGREDRLLVCLRPAHKRHGGLWEFPGGKCEPGETDEAALRRELREELGVEVTRCGTPLFERRDPGSPFLIVFLPVEVGGEPVALEHERIHWALRSELTPLRLAPSDRAFVQWLGARPLPHL